MNILVLDFETYFDKDFNLSKLTCEEYVRDPRFEVHGYAMWQPALEPEPSWGWNMLHQIDWSNTACLCHHAQFDGLILSHIYDLRPAAWLDTLSMSRLLLGNHVKHSLDGLREHFHMTLKSTPYKQFKGLHWDQMSPQLQRSIAEGCIDEVRSIYEIFTRFMTGDY